MDNISVINPVNCFSCRSCYQSCPKSAISMNENEEGFFYPVVDDKKCIDCGICKKSCPAIELPYFEKIGQEFWCAYLKDTNKIQQSSSGGIFAGIADYILSKNGVVFGAAYDSKLFVRHVFAENENDLQQLKGSKYVESSTANSFEQAKKNLVSGRKVLYSGCPCQIAGLRKYLKIDYDNLITVDIICHGVPSSKLFQKYLEWLGRRLRGTISYYGFRDKDVGGWGSRGKTKNEARTKLIEGLCDPYYSSFLRGETCRESCYKCPFANLNRMGDITIGDFWGVECFYPKIKTKQGVSCVIVNSQRGKELLSCCSGDIDLIRSTKENVVFDNGNLIRPTQRPNIRDTIYSGIDDNLDIFFKRFKRKYLFQVKIKKVLIALIPRRLKGAIKKILRSS